MIKKIAIVGNSGSGKTTLAFQLHKKCNLPLYHIDQYYWGAGWQRPDPEEFKNRYGELCKKDAWIIEGAYIRGFRQRAELADIVIFLDMPRYKCLWRVVRRSIVNWGDVIPGDPHGCKQRLFSFKFLEFLKWIWDFNKKHRKTILAALDEVRGKKPVYVLKSSDEINQLFR